jgi:ornithine lipid ester-linked acyl 2-hydroxylase
MAVSKLEANTKINPHRGDTDAIIRCHMGIKVPEKLPECGFRVNNTEKSWEELKTFGFIDANEHEAWNNTSSERIILLFDVIRPEFRSKKLQISIRVRAFLLTQVLLFKIPFLLKAPKKSLLPLYYCIWMLLWCLYPLQKKYGVFRKHD